MKKLLFPTREDYTLRRASAISKKGESEYIEPPVFPKIETISKRISRNLGHKHISGGLKKYSINYFR